MPPSHNTDPEQTRNELSHQPSIAEIASMMVKLYDEAASNNQTQDFFQVEYVGPNANKIGQMIRFSLQPTGARRQEKSPKTFSQAQFKVNAADCLSDQTDEYFTWCATGPQTWGESPIPNEIALHEQYGVQPLTIVNIVKCLVPCSEGIDSYAMLCDLLEERDVKAPAVLAETMSMRTYSMFNNLLNKKGASLNSLEGQEILELLQLLGRVNKSSFSHLRGRMVSKLLQQMSGQLSIETTDLQLSAAQTLSEMIQLGTIDAYSSTMTRVLSSGLVYRHKFGVDALYDRLCSDPSLRVYENVYGQSRELFAHDFMLSVISLALRSESKLQNSETEKKLRQELLYWAGTHRRQSDLYNDIFSTAAEVDKIGVDPVDGIKWNEINGDDNQYRLGRAFGVILDALVDDNHPNAAASHALNQRCIEIVETILLPVNLSSLRRRLDSKDIGRQVIALTKRKQKINSEMGLTVTIIPASSDNAKARWFLSGQ